MNWFTANPNTEAKRLIQQLLDGTKRDRAAQDLIKLGAPAAPALIEALLARDPNLPTLAKQILIRIGSSVTPTLITTLRNAPAPLRAQAAHVIGQMKDPSTLPALIESLHSEFFAVREQTVYALGNFAQPQTLQSIINMCSDPEPEVRAAACLAIAQFKNTNNYNKLSDMLFDDPELIVRQSAVKALVNAKDPAVLPILMDALRDSFWWYGREDAADLLLSSISEFGTQAVDSLIVALADKEGTVRRFAAASLGKIRDPRAMDALGMAIYDLHHEVGEAAADALSYFGGASLEILFEAAHHAEADVRSNAIKALAKINDPRVTPMLLELINDPDRENQKQVVFALGTLKDARALPTFQTLSASRTDREMALLAKEALQKFNE